MVFNKRGQVGLTQIVGALILIFVLAVGLFTFIGFSSSGGGASQFAISLQESLNSVTQTILLVVEPLFGFILGFGNDSNTNFLMVLTFILISIVIVGTLDSVNIFGDNKQGGLINLFVGIIVSIIGVRFMPADMWSSLTAPSSAFVAAILVGVPFVALFFVSMKVKYSLARKVLWLFYLVMVVYLTIRLTNSSVLWAYLLFAILAIIMLFLDSTVRRYFYLEKHKKDIEDTIGSISARERYKLRREIEEWQKIINDPTASAAEVADAKRRLKRVQDRYGDASLI